DRFGRRAPLLISLGICIAAGIACALAPTIGLLILFRFIQGLAGAGCIVLSRAVVADTSTGVHAQRIFAVMTAIGGLAPVLAPLLGSVVIEFTGWREVFWVLVLLTVVMFAGALWGIPESLPPSQRHSGGLGTLARHTRGMLGDRQFTGLVAALSLSFAVMFAYIPASPFVLQGTHGLSAGAFAITFAANALGLALA
ncbi:MFS transporter, partial [Staphylococcus haemolyticus]|uniref:MFS transporter n=1 Tax=Staphylococcus haemolyticus TaxID=1283 RepID=UPI00265BA23E